MTLSMDVATFDQPQPGEEALDAPMADHPSWRKARGTRWCDAACGREADPNAPPGVEGYCSPACWRRNNGLPAVRPAPVVSAPVVPPASRLAVVGREWCEVCGADHDVYGVRGAP